MIRRILLVEDDPTFAKLLQAQLRLLSSPRCETVRVATLAEARVSLANERFDAVLTDLGLPDSDGPDTVTALIAIARGAPVVVLSGSEDAPPGHAFLQKGGITPGDLARTLEGLA